MKSYLLAVALILSSLPAFAQFPTSATFGARAGITYSNINKLSEILVSEDYYSGYEFSAQSKVSPTASLFFNYRKPDRFIGMELDLNYYQLASAIEYTDVNTLNYTTTFKYHYAGFGGYLKVYPVAGFNIALGGRAGFCVKPEGIAYKSNQESLTEFNYETVSETEKQLNKKIKGTTDIGIGGSLGYEFPFGLCASIGYHYSILDMVSTEANDFRWIDPANRGYSVQLAVGYGIGVSNR